LPEIVLFMKKVIHILLVCLALALTACKNKKSATQTPAPIPTPTVQQTPTQNPDDVVVILHQDMLNKVFKALGVIKGKEAYKVLFMTDTAYWTLINPHIALHPGKADFVTDVNVISGPFNYTTKVIGDVKIWYDKDKNLINVKVTRAIGELYTKVLGKKVHITDIDFATYFEDPFTFEGPAATESDMDVDMPDGTKKKLYLRSTFCDLRVEEKRIVVPCEMEVTATPPAVKPGAPQKK
jgi:hypothetical protein